MENENIQHIYSEEELAEQKKQKSRNRVFGILVGLVVLLSIISVIEFVWLVTH